MNLIDCNLQKDERGKWGDFVDGGDGFLYGMPWNARKVLQFKIDDKSTREIGQDVGKEADKYSRGVRAANGSIYCVPGWSKKHFLKITPRGGGDAEVQILDHLTFPEDGNNLWLAGALGNDGCIYYMPFDGHRILKLDPNDDDRLSLVGEDLGGEQDKYGGAVASKDGTIYGIPYIGSEQIVKFNLQDNSATKVGVAFEEEQRFCGGVLAADNNIYAANRFGQILLIDTNKNDYMMIGDRINSKREGWGSPVLGADGCIYFPPSGYNRVLKFNPISQKVSFVDKSFGELRMKWHGCGSMAKDGFIYCAPFGVNHILQIDARPTDIKINSIVCGTDDCSKNNPDRLGYHKYAKALARVTRSIESPNTSVCVGLLGEWGAGKSFLWGEIKDELKGLGERGSKE